MQSPLPIDSDGVGETSAPASERKRGRTLIWGTALLSLSIAATLVVTRELTDPAMKDTKVAAPVAVQAAQVSRGSLDVEREYPGELVSEAAELAAEVSARVESVEIELGDHVKQGDPLVRLDGELLIKARAQARAQVRADKAAAHGAETRREAARRELARGEALKASAVVSDAELDALRSAVQEAEADANAARARSESARAQASLLDAQVEHATVRAPFNGVVAQRWVDPGAFLRAGDPVLRLVRADGLRVEFKIPETDIAIVDVGDPIRCVARGVESQSFAGTVARTSGEVSSADRSLLVEGQLDPRAALPGSLKPGMYTQVHVVVERLSEATLVPIAAVLERISADGSRKTGVFVDRKGQARFIELEIRGRSNTHAAVAGELQISDLVLIRGHRELSDDTPIRVEGEVLGQVNVGGGGAPGGGAPGGGAAL